MCNRHHGLSWFAGIPRLPTLTNHRPSRLQRPISCIQHLRWAMLNSLAERGCSTLFGHVFDTFQLRWNEVAQRSYQKLNLRPVIRQALVGLWSDSQFLQYQPAWKALFGHMENGSSVIPDLGLDVSASMSHACTLNAFLKQLNHRTGPAGGTRCWSCPKACWCRSCRTPVTCSLQGWVLIKLVRFLLF